MLLEGSADTICPQTRGRRIFSTDERADRVRPDPVSVPFWGPKDGHVCKYGKGEEEGAPACRLSLVPISTPDTAG